MSCRTTSGGSVSTSLARMVSGLEDKDIQHLFHALKREGAGQPVPSELALTQWRERQQDMLERASRMSEKRKDAMRNKLFRSRTEPVPDGSMFYAWSQIEARARQELVVRSIGTAVDLAPPGSQADQYELGPDGRPVSVMYASYGSNLHRDRFMTYIEGGTPPGGRRHYPGCTDKTAPEFDIPIRYHGGFRTHFALTSSVWHGGIAFLDKTENDESATALGRAYKLSIEQFDEVVHFENGGYVAKSARAVPMAEVLTEGRAVTGPGAYETMMHIGDYEGMPVITFTAPFSAHEALTRAGSLNRNNVRLPVMTNKPSAAYCRMIGQGLQETFGIDEVAAADYLRGMPGAATSYSRQEMVKVLRAPAPPAQPEKSVGYTGASRPAFSNWDKNRGDKTGYMNPDSVKEWLNGRKNAPEDTPSKTPRASRPKTDTLGVRFKPLKNGDYLPGVKVYANGSEQEEGVNAWSRKVKAISTDIESLRSSHAFWSGRDPEGFAAKDAGAQLDRYEAALTEAKAKHAKAKAQTPAQHFPDADAYFPSQWQRMAEDAATKARVARAQIKREQALDGGGSARKIRTLEARAAAAEQRAKEATKKADAATAKAEPVAPKSKGKGKAATGGNRLGRKVYPGVKTYPTLVEQDFGVRGWRRQLETERRRVRSSERFVARAAEQVKNNPGPVSEEALRLEMQHLDKDREVFAEVKKKHAAALRQDPMRTQLATGTTTTNDLREHLTRYRNEIKRAEHELIKAERRISRKDATDYDHETFGIAEDRLALFTRAQDAALDALDRARAQAVSPPKVSPVRKQDKSA